MIVNLVSAARPNFMKIAPLYHCFSVDSRIDMRIVHTGQHYDFNMSDALLRDLRVPKVHANLGVGSGTHAQQTGNVMIRYEEYCLQSRPDWTIVVGDVNSTAACAIVSSKLAIPVIHLEAGLRSRDRTMPEEINRLITDAISDVLWTPSADADDNLKAEGVSPQKIDRIGNIMIDSFEMLREKIKASSTRSRLGLEKSKYIVVTLHRPANVDSPESLTPIVESLRTVSTKVAVVLVAHPRTMKSLQDFGLGQFFRQSRRLLLCEPLSYIEFMNLVVDARAVITDSGGLQEETTYLGIPCLTLRPNTERPITITEGTNRLVTFETLERHVDMVLDGNWPKGSCPDLWDGRTAQRALEVFRQRVGM